MPYNKDHVIGISCSGKEYIDNGAKEVFSIDFDGTLTDGSSYENLIPNQDIINKVKQLYFQGHIIIIWSARQWDDAYLIAGWCILHHIPYHGIMCGKGGTNHYVDDKSVTLKDFLKRK